jgi:hypothetical protein
MTYNRTMRKQIIRDSIIIGGLIVAILFVFTIGLPFLVSDEFDELALKLLGK